MLIVMEEKCERLTHNTLTAEELLHNKGIRSSILEEWERSSQTLPKTGQKHFEPNNSWLENVQIEKGLKIRRDLLSIERVNRICDLASAEWIPMQKKALVTKRSGQDWNNFGLEKNGSLYLLPEEALFLLETNCLELIWNGVPCSIQQAYEILIDDSVCTLEEYRVYSQLTRYGYRIQRYLYEESEKYSRLDESIKRKVIVDPENGLKIYDNQSQIQQTAEQTKEILIRTVPELSNKSCIKCNTKDHQNNLIGQSVEQAVYDVMEQLLHNIESENVDSPLTSGVIESNIKQSNITNEEKTRNSKVEIISDETLLGNVKILRSPISNPKKDVFTTLKWPGSRIQRNVKLLPKRTDKLPTGDASMVEPACTNKNSNKRELTFTQTIIESSHTKKTKHEIIEISDDEIQELPRPMTRMEMLNLLPNIASQTDIEETISIRYIPHNIKPQKNTYLYNRAKISRMQDNDKTMRQYCKGTRTNIKQNAFHFNTDPSRSPLVGNRNSAHNQQARSHLYSPSRPFYSLDHMHGSNFGLPYTYNRFPFNYGQSAYGQNRFTLMQQNVFQNMFVAFENHGNALQHSRSFTIQMNNFAMPIVGGFRMRHPLAENQHGFYHNFSWQPKPIFYQRRMMENSLVHGNTHVNARRRSDEMNRGSSSQTSHDVINRPSFTIRLDAGSWTELKKKWHEEKTITIDDEDCKNKNENREECNEVQFVEQLINPLIGPRNAFSLTDVYSKLAIIKSAPEKTVRRKKSRYKISYNVYSCTHHYRKANPGQPLFSLVVIRKENPFLQPVELNRLQQDAKGSQIILAYVSMSISYIQPSIITMPNIT